MIEVKHIERNIIDKYLQTKGVGISRENAIKIVSNELGVPDDFVRAVLKSSGYYCERCKKFTTFNHEKAVKLYRENYSIWRIAKMFGETYTVIRKALIMHGVKLKGKGGRKEYFKIVKKKHGAKVPIHATTLREMGIVPKEGLYGIWIKENGKVKLRIVEEPHPGAYKLTRVGSVRKDGKISTMAVNIPVEICRTLNSEYGRWRIESEDTLVLELE